MGPWDDEPGAPGLDADRGVAADAEQQQDGVVVLAGRLGRIDATEASGKNYDAILLLFGVCGNATVGIQARRTRLVIPRAHDCCTILLGSKASFTEHFGKAPSTPFSSAGYIERGSYFLRTEDDGSAHVQMGDSYQALVEKYGEEDAKYIWAEMYPEHKDRKSVV